MKLIASFLLGTVCLKTATFSLLGQEASTPGMRSGAVSAGRYTTCQGRVSETVESYFRYGEYERGKRKELLERHLKISESSSPSPGGGQVNRSRSSTVVRFAKNSNSSAAPATGFAGGQRANRKQPALVPQPEPSSHRP